MSIISRKILSSNKDIDGDYIQYAHVTSTTARTLTVDTGDGWVAPKPGNIIFAVGSYRLTASLSSITIPSGFTLIQESLLLTSAGFVAWKVADGTETSFSATTSGGTLSTEMLAIIEFPGIGLNSATLHDSDIDTSKRNSNTKTVTTGTSTLAASRGCAYGFAMPFSGNNWEPATCSWDNDFVAQAAILSPGTPGRACVYVATKVLVESGDYTSTFTTTDTGNNIIGAMAIFAG